MGAFRTALALAIALLAIARYQERSDQRSRAVGGQQYAEPATVEAEHVASDRRRHRDVGHAQDHRWNHHEKDAAHFGIAEDVAIAVDQIAQS